MRYRRWANGGTPARRPTKIMSAITTSAPAEPAAVDQADEGLEILLQCPISSFYLRSGSHKAVRGQATDQLPCDCLFCARRPFENELASVRDPMGISGMVHPCSSVRRRQIALSRLTTAATRAEKALHHHDRNPANAFRFWDLLFGSYFPAR